MTVAGWFTMLVSITLITALFIWCMYRVLKYKPPLEKLHGIDDIDTQDQDEDKNS